MLQFVKSGLRVVFDTLLKTHGLELVRTPPSGKDYSYRGEESVIRHFVERIAPTNHFFVDIGASWGIEMSNTLELAQQGWSGLAAEYEPDKFARLARSWQGFDVRLFRGRVMPGNVVAVLDAAEVPQDFAFLSLDIDSWDAFVLERLLTKYRPALVCAEVNETIPPPIKFTVCPSDAPLWLGGNFFGASISYMADVADSADYIILRQHYNNVFLAPRECGLPGLTPDAAYAEGYRDKPDRDALYPYNVWMKSLWNLSPEELLASVQARFANQTAPYCLSL